MTYDVVSDIRARALTERERELDRREAEVAKREWRADQHESERRNDRTDEKS